VSGGSTRGRVTPGALAAASPRTANKARRTLTWWIGVLFAVGSTCFLIGPFPGFVELVGSTIDGIVFFVGSVFFTTAATLQLVQAGTAGGPPQERWLRRVGQVLFQPGRVDWWSSAVQVAGTLFFNVSTFHAMQAGLKMTEYDRLVWAPDAFGSACFLASGALACLAVRGGFGHRTREWWIATVNFLGCVAFGVAAVASYFVPSTGTILDLAAANGFTALGALCFLIGAVLLARGARQ
jgi:hypothetical protein